MSICQIFDDAPSYRTLAGIYIEEGDFKNARICLEKASVPSFNDMTRFFGTLWLFFVRESGG